MTGHTEDEPAPAGTRHGVLLICRWLVCAAAAAAAYLAWVSWSGGPALGCGPESGCDKVLHSQWGYWFGVPVSLVALPVYVALLLATRRLGPDTPPLLQRRAWRIALPCALMVAGAAAWFVGLQLFVIHSLCLYCMAAHAAGFLAALLLMIAAPVRRSPNKPWEVEKQVFIPTATSVKLALMACAGLALLVAGQVLYKKPTGQITPVANIAPPARALETGAPPVSVSATSAPVPTAGAASVVTRVVPADASVSSVAPAPRPGAVPSPLSRPFGFYSGKFEIDLYDVPLIGLPQARHVMVSLFDYTCHHCKIMHERLLEAHRAFSNDLVIASLPMPLDPACNYTMKRTTAAHSNACEYARLGLAVWAADRAKHRQFDEWLFAPEKPPPLAEAQARADELVGGEPLKQALASDWVKQQLKQNVDIYATAYAMGQGSMPQLIVSSNIAVGTFSSEELSKILSDNFGLKAAP